MITRNGGCRSPISICPISTRHQHCQNYGWDRTMNSWTWMLQRGMELFSTRYKQVSLIHLIYVSFLFNISLLLYYLIILHEVQSLSIIFYHFLFRSLILPLFLIFFVTSRLKILIAFSSRLLSRELRQGELEIVKRLLELEQLYQVEPHNASSIDRRCFKFGTGWPTPLRRGVKSHLVPSQRSGLHTLANDI